MESAQLTYSKNSVRKCVKNGLNRDIIHVKARVVKFEISVYLAIAAKLKVLVESVAMSHAMFSNMVELDWNNPLHIHISEKFEIFLRNLRYF